VTGLLRAGTNALAINASPADPTKQLSIYWVDWTQPPPDNTNNTGSAVTTTVAGSVDSTAFSQQVSPTAGQTKTVSIAQHLANPKVWWPYEMGSQPLYHLAVGNDVVDPAELAEERDGQGQRGHDAGQHRQQGGVLPAGGDPEGHRRGRGDTNHLE
jgi:hypothetical protein